MEMLAVVSHFLVIALHDTKTRGEESEGLHFRAVDGSSQR